MCLPAPVLLCGFAYRAAHESRCSTDKQWTDDTLDAWGCCQRKSEKKSNATLNTQLVFTGREQECEECLQSEFVPESKVLIKCVPGNGWNFISESGCWESPSLYILLRIKLNEISIPCMRWESSSATHTHSFNGCGDIAAELHCRPEFKVSTLTDSQTGTGFTVDLVLRIFVKIFFFTIAVPYRAHG